MIHDSIRTYRIQLDPEGTMPNIDVGVRVDGRDISDVRADSVAMIFVDCVVHTLEELFGLDKSKVDSIREDLEAGRPVHIEVQALRIPTDPSRIHPRVKYVWPLLSTVR